MRVTDNSAMAQWRFPFESAALMTAPASPSRPRRPGSLLRGVLLWGLLPLLLIIFAGLSSLYAICLYKPELVIAFVQRHLHEGTGMPWRIKGSIRPVAIPHPGLVVSEVSLMAATREQSRYADTARPLAHVARLSLYVDPASLSRLAPRFHLIELVDPAINLVYDRHGRPLWLPLPDPDVPGDSVISELPDVPGPGPEAEEPVAGDSGEALRRVADIFTLPPQAMQPVLIRNGSFRSYAEDGRLLLSFSGIDGFFEPGAPEDNIHLSTAFALPAAGLALTVSLAARVGCGGIPARGRLSGRLDMTPPGSRTLSGEFGSGFLWRKDGRYVDLPGFGLTAEGDAVSADLTIDLAEAKCTGTVRIHNLSLPRWFDFARSLPPGLSQALDSLVGEFDLRLDLYGAEARNLRGTVGGLPVSGYVGAPNFSTPVITVDLDLDEADLDVIFPFLAVAGALIPDPEAPVFDHPPLVPYPSDPAAPSRQGKPGGEGREVSYDVTVRVARSTIHAVDGGLLEVRVFPAMAEGAEKVRVAFNAPSILEGSLDGRLDIDKQAILMYYNVRGLELRLLPENQGSSVTFGGKISGICEIDVPLLGGGHLADDWTIRINAEIRNCEILGHDPGSKWRLFAGTVRAKGQGEIYAAQDRGISITGLWDIAAAGITTSWFPRGDDAITGVFNGGLHWPPMRELPGDPPAGCPDLPAGRPDLIEKRGIDKVAGSLDLSGSLIVPLGSFLGPLTGRMQAFLDWRLHGESLALRDIVYEGFGSYAQGSVDIDFSGSDTRIASEVNGQFNVPEVFEAWGATPSWVELPQRITGRTAISSAGGSLRFDAIRVSVDGAPVNGDIFWQASSESGAAGLWTLRLTANNLDLDKYFPPAPDLPPGQRPPPPSPEPWDLSFLEGLGIDAQIMLPNARKDNLSFGRSRVVAVLQRDRFSVQAESAAFYGGRATVVLQGAVESASSQIILRQGLLQVENADLGEILYDFSQDTSLGGNATLVVNATGAMRSNADIPRALSGIWDLRIVDGLYPAFIGGETLRNTFSSASASGVLERGVLRSRNFSLTGIMLEMNGGGWFDLASKDYDVEVSVTFARVPTIPVRFFGSVYEPRMRVRGVDMVTETVQQAGGTVFGLLRGVLLLPAHAVVGVTELFGGGTESRRRPARTDPIAPIRQQTGHPGQ